MQIPENYCIHIHGGLLVNLTDDDPNKIDIRPCAYYPAVDIVNPDTNAFMNENLLNLRKKTVLDGPCASCQFLEETGQRCAIKNSLHDEFVKDNLYFNLSGPINLRFKIDITCNLACAICSPLYSSKWRSEEKIKKNSSVNSDALSKLIDNLDLSNLRRVQILGGEPFLSKNHKLILEKLLPYAHNISLVYHTNGTVKVSNDIVELWKQFKILKIKFSIDAIEDAFHYLRWPGKWDEVVDNLEYYRNLRLENLRMALTPAVGILNLFMMNDLKFWYIRNFRRDLFFNPISFDPLPTEDTFSLQGLSQQMIDDARILYENQSTILQYIPHKETTNNLDIVKKKLIELDKKRNLDYAHYLPQLARYLPK